MSKPERETRRVQVRMTTWLYQIVKERSDGTGKQEWKIIEGLMEAGLAAESRASELVQALGGSLDASTTPKQYTDSDSYETFLCAASCLKSYFQTNAGEFMRTVSRLRGEKKALPASLWRKWAKAERVPKDYISTIKQVVSVTDGIYRAERNAGLFDNLPQKK